MLSRDQDVAEVVEWGVFNSIEWYEEVISAHPEAKFDSQLGVRGYYVNRLSEVRYSGKWPEQWFKGAGPLLRSQILRNWRIGLAYR